MNAPQANISSNSWLEPLNMRTALYRTWHGMRLCLPGDAWNHRPWCWNCHWKPPACREQIQWQTQDSVPGIWFWWWRRAYATGVGISFDSPLYPALPARFRCTHRGLPPHLWHFGRWRWQNHDFWVLRWAKACPRPSSGCWYGGFAECHRKSDEGVQGDPSGTWCSPVALSKKNPANSQPCSKCAQLTLKVQLLPLH